MKVLAVAVTLVALFAGAFAAPAASADDQTTEEAPSFQEFLDTIHLDPDDVWVINGDEPVYSKSPLRDLHESLYQASSDSEQAPVENQLVVNIHNGAWDKWDATTAQNLTYCVSQKTFGTRYSTMVSAAASASAAWEAAANVDFRHVPVADTSCTTKNDTVLFTIEQVCTGRYLARAFFPHARDRHRRVLVDCTSFGNIAPFSLTGVMRHELGHALGFRHEHTRPDAGVCFEDNQWAPLTAYDSASVMHYPQCNGTNNGDLSLTSLDAQGAAVLYP